MEKKRKKGEKDAREKEAKEKHKKSKAKQSKRIYIFLKYAIRLNDSCSPISLLIFPEYEFCYEYAMSFDSLKS